MMKTGIVYATKTKHSEKLAREIGSALGIKAENIASRPELRDIDLLFIVGGIYGGESLPELLEYTKGLDRSEIRAAALVTSCASGKQKQKSVRKILEENGVRVVDEFICRGSILFIYARHPNADDKTAAVDFARSVMKRLVTGA